jgi:hypothetical protein
MSAEPWNALLRLGKDGPMSAHVTLETPNLVLRELGDGDAAAVHVYASGAAVLRHRGSRIEIRSPAHGSGIVGHWLQVAPGMFSPGPRHLG